LRKGLERRGISSAGLALAVLSPSALGAAVCPALAKSCLDAVFGKEVAEGVSALILTTTPIKGIAMKTVVVSLTLVGLGVGIASFGLADPLVSVDEKKTEQPKATAKRADGPGDPLPDGAIVRPGTRQLLASANSALAEPPAPKDGPLGMKFVPLPKGTFFMGWDGKKKGVKTEIKEPFEIAIHVVTQEQWEKVMGNNPSFFSRNGGGKDKVKDVKDEELKQFPVENVSWQDCQDFIKKLNEKEAKGGYVYRLPTETEWEWACRGGATSEEECSFNFYFDKPTNVLSSKQANFGSDTPLGRPTKVGSYVPNKLGLYDMHGNVWQRCELLKHPKGVELVIRGGCYSGPAYSCTAAYHGRGGQRASEGLGLRLARVPSGDK
jgi:formylglycine-generating enzyme required for sulfatase activity